MIAADCHHLAKYAGLHCPECAAKRVQDLVWEKRVAEDKSASAFFSAAVYREDYRYE
jgi:hypothetical protein